MAEKPIVDPAMEDPDVDEVVLDIVTKLKSFADFKDFKLGQLPDLVIKAMEIVEDFRGLSGKGKKQLVIKSVAMIIDESDVTGPVEPFVLMVVPPLIDDLIAVDAGKMKVNKGGFIARIFKMMGCCTGNGCKGGNGGCCKPKPGKKEGCCVPK